jgi:DNA-directed RNA polymerase specialized sigma24 family protein
MSGGGRSDPATEAFLAHRNLLFTVAYEMLGSAADAEDVLQETWLRWANVDLDTVRDQRAYLVRITTRQRSLVTLSAPRRRRAPSSRPQCQVGGDRQCGQPCSQPGDRCVRQQLTGRRTRDVRRRIEPATVSPPPFTDPSGVTRRGGRGDP